VLERPARLTTRAPGRAPCAPTPPQSTPARIDPRLVKREYRNYAQAEALMQRTGHLHNSALRILVELGVAGLLVRLWIWAAFFTEAVRLLRRLPAAAIGERALVAGSIAAITAFLVAGTSEYNFGDSEVVMLPGSSWRSRMSSPGEALLRL
jgi:hypothetical protein